jgi:hypothetical protein
VINPGDWHKASHRGRFLVKKVAELPQPAVSHTEKWGETSFRPVLAEIQWENGAREFWFPYYIGTVGKERYAQFAPMVSETQFFELMEGAIDQGFFSHEALARLETVVARTIHKQTVLPSQRMLQSSDSEGPTVSILVPPQP